MAVGPGLICVLPAVVAQSCCWRFVQYVPCPLLTLWPVVPTHMPFAPPCRRPRPRAEGVSCARICKTGLDESRSEASLAAWRRTFPYDYSGSYSDCIKSCAKDQTARREYTDQYGNSCNDICENDTEGSFGGSSVEECQGCCASYYTTGAPAPTLLCVTRCHLEQPPPPPTPSLCSHAYSHPAALPAPACWMQAAIPAPALAAEPPPAPTRRRLSLSCHTPGALQHTPSRQQVLGDNIPALMHACLHSY